MKRNVQQSKLIKNFILQPREIKRKRYRKKTQRKCRGWHESRQGCDDDNHISFINIRSDGNLKGNSVMSVLLFQGNQLTGMVYVGTLSLHFFVVHILSLEEQKPFYIRIIREMGNNEGLFFFFTLLCCELIMVW